MAVKHLAHRLEAVEAALSLSAARAQRLARPQKAAAEVESIAGGQAVFFGVGSPLSQAIGIGMSGPVSESDLDRLEEFFRSRGSGVTISLCPFADFALPGLLSARGYRLSHFENTLARPLALPGEQPAPTPAGVQVRPAVKQEAELWARLTMAGFEMDPTPETIGLFTSLFDGTGDVLLALADGSPAGGGCLQMHERVGLFAGDSTLPEFRGRGVQSALIATRLGMATAAGCNLAMACTQPGSVSERNYERQRFRVLYTKAMMVRQFT